MATMYLSMNVCVDTLIVVIQRRGAQTFEQAFVQA
jgi:hypothetical protein